jgi:flagellar basal body-associated protein FliL
MQPDPRHDSGHGEHPENSEEVHGLDLFADAEEAEPTRRRAKTGWIFAVAALIVVILGVIVIVNLTGGSDTPADSASKSVAAQVRKADDAKTLSADAEDGKFTVIYSAKVDAFAVEVSGVDAAPEDQEYQVSVTHSDAAETFERVGLLGAEPTGWHGYRGLDSVRSVHLTIVAEGGEDAPEQADLSEITLEK